MLVFPASGADSWSSSLRNNVNLTDKGIQHPLEKDFNIGIIWKSLKAVVIAALLMAGSKAIEKKKKPTGQ